MKTALLIFAVWAVLIGIWGLSHDMRRRWDAWMFRRDERRLSPLLVECERRARGEGLDTWEAFVERYQFERTLRDIQQLPEISVRGEAPQS